MFKELLANNKALPWKIADRILSCNPTPLIMGIVNTTPDSFFDGGKHNAPDQAFAHSLKLLDEGAVILDIGGESSRPGSKPVSVQEELDRVCPVVERLAPLAKEKGFLEWIFAFMYSNNTSQKMAKRNKADVIREYALYGKEI